LIPVEKESEYIDCIKIVLLLQDSNLRQPLVTARYNFKLLFFIYCYR